MIIIREYKLGPMPHYWSRYNRHDDLSIEDRVLIIIILLISAIAVMIKKSCCPKHIFMQYFDPWIH